MGWIILTSTDEIEFVIKMTRIALLKSDVETRGEVAACLRADGHRVVEFRRCFALGVIEADSAPSILVYDKVLPDGDGLEAATALATKHKDMGLVMLPSDSDDDRVNALRRGVDHCLSVPTRPDELLAVVNNLARRLGRQGDWRIDSINLILHTPDGHSVPITRQEHLFLHVLNNAPSQTLTREKLVRALARGEYDERSLDSIAARLRKKVSAVTRLRFPLITVHGSGYSLSTTLN